MTLPYVIRMFFVSLVLSACVSTPPVKMGEYYPRKIENIDQILHEIEERNNAIEKHPEWILLAKQDFMVKKLDDISESAYAGYRK